LNKEVNPTRDETYGKNRICGNTCTSSKVSNIAKVNRTKLKEKFEKYRHKCEEELKL
jgi:hypothetical protein